MKKFYVVVFVLIALLSLMGCSEIVASESNENEQSVEVFILNDEILVKSSSFGALGSESEEILTLRNMLKYAIEDEYLSLAEYELTIEKYGQIQPFANIMEAEKRHIEYLTPLFEKYNVEIPDNIAQKFIVLPETIEEAVQTCVDGEIVNIAMYDRFLEEDLPEDVREVFIKLRDASKNHLRAFQNVLEGKDDHQGKREDGEHGEGKMHGKDKDHGENKGHGVEVEASAELINLADELESEGDLESAALVLEEAVKADAKNIGLYKKLGKLYDKMGNNGVRAYVNGVHPQFDVPPVIKEGRVLIPFRAISEALKAEVLWNQEERSVTVTRGDTVVILIINSHIALVNGVEVSLDVPVQVENGRTLVPIRFLSEAFKAEVIWEQETKSVIIIEEENMEQD